MLNKSIVVLTACPQEGDGRDKTQMGCTEQVVADRRQWDVP